MEILDGEKWNHMEILDGEKVCKMEITWRY
jgi:hypothetical protein